MANMRLLLLGLELSELSDLVEKPGKTFTATGGISPPKF